MRWLPVLALAALASTTDLAQAARVLVSTVAAQPGSLPRTVVGFGTTHSAPGGSETLSVLATQVKQVLVSAGQPVQQGQALMVLGADPSTIATYKQAVSALTLAQSERARLTQMLAQHLATRDQAAQAAKAASDAQVSLDVLKSSGGDGTGQTLRAGFDGVVSVVSVATGARVPADTPLIVLERSNSVVAAQPAGHAGGHAGRAGDAGDNGAAALRGGLTFNIMTLGGIAAAVGLVIDDVITMVEHLARRAGGHDGEPTTDVLAAAHEFLPPLTGSSMATLLVFLPLAFLSGVTGAFFKALSLTMAAALVISYALTALAVPVLTRFIVDVDRWQDPGQGEEGRVGRAHRRLLKTLFRRPWLLLPCLAALLLLGWFAFNAVGSGFMPKMDEGGFVLDFPLRPRHLAGRDHARTRPGRSDPERDARG